MMQEQPEKYGNAMEISKDYLLSLRELESILDDSGMEALQSEIRKTGWKTALLPRHLNPGDADGRNLIDALNILALNFNTEFFGRKIRNITAEQFKAYVKAVSDTIDSPPEKKFTGPKTIDLVKELHDRKERKYNKMGAVVEKVVENVDPDSGLSDDYLKDIKEFVRISKLSGGMDAVKEKMIATNWRPRLYSRLFYKHQQKGINEKNRPWVTLLDDEAKRFTIKMGNIGNAERIRKISDEKIMDFFDNLIGIVHRGKSSADYEGGE